MADTLQQFKEYLADISRLSQAAALLSWDLETGCPRAGVAKRAEAMGLLSQEIFSRSVSERMGGFLDTLAATELSDDDRALVRVVKRDYDKAKAIPPALVRDLSVTAAQAQPAWEQAKADAAFPAFAPHLEKLLALKCEMADIVGWQGHRYDALLDDYEPGLTVAELDPLLATLRADLVPLAEAIIARQGPVPALPAGGYPVAAQRALGEEVLRLLGYDFAAGRLDASAHPFSITISAGDHRVTTRFDERDFRPSFFSVLHEGGHALYEMGIPAKFHETPLGEGCSMAVHESQSRFWENIVGRSRAVLEYVRPVMARHLPALDGLDSDALYRLANGVQRSLIRTEADEVTYNLHVMLRYELEKGLLDGSLAVADLPAAWNAKLRDYLGLTPTSDRAGVLQDVHWAHGSFGYFPSYLLGNLYAAQLADDMTRDLDLDACLRRGDLRAPLAWLREKVHAHGRALLPAELLQRATGNAPDARYFLAYLRHKFLN